MARFGVHGKELSGGKPEHGRQRQCFVSRSKLRGRDEQHDAICTSFAERTPVSGELSDVLLSGISRVNILTQYSNICLRAPISENKPVTASLGN